MIRRPRLCALTILASLGPLACSDPSPSGSRGDGTMPGIDEQQILDAVASDERERNVMLVRAHDCADSSLEAAARVVREALGPDLVEGVARLDGDRCAQRIGIRSDTDDQERKRLSTAMERVAFDDALKGRVTVSTNGWLRSASLPNDPLFGAQWGLSNTGQIVGGEPGTAGEDIGVTPVWDSGEVGSAAVVVAILDTGMDLSHPDLTPNLWSGCLTSPASCDFTGQGSPADNPSFPHGTLVSGIVGAKGDDGFGATGVAWDVSLMPLKICNDQGYCTNQALLDAIAFAQANGAKVVNMSFGSPVYSQTVASAIASANDTLFVAGAGNDGTDAPFYPAALPYDHLVSVAAIDNRGQLARFTSSTSTNYGSWVELAAPGRLVLSTNHGGGHDWVSGTSFATPFVSGVAALAFSAGATSAASVGLDLIATARPLAPQTLDPHKHIAGGLVDATALVAPGGSPTDYLGEPWGMAGDVPLVGDWLGTGHLALTVFRPSEGTWYAKAAASEETPLIVSFGADGDVPLAGDFLGVGRDQLTVFRPSDGTWWLMDAATWQTQAVSFGAAGDLPLAGDLMGDGRDEVAVHRPSTGDVWAVDLGTLTTKAVPVGQGTALTGDVLGLGHEQVAVFDAGTWTVADLVGDTSVSVSWGSPGDHPFVIPADSGADAIAVFRPSEGIVYMLDITTQLTRTVWWGSDGDVPFAGDFLQLGGVELAQWRPSDGFWWITPLDQ